MPESRKIYLYNIILLLSLLGLIVIVLIMSLYRGIEFGDEGFALLSYKNVDLYRGGLFNFHIIVNKFTGWLNPGIIVYRWLSIILTVLSSLILSLCLCRWLKSIFNKKSFYTNFLFVFCFISIGNFLSYSAGVSAISYNTLINFTLQTATALVIYIFSFKPGEIIKQKKIWILLVLISILCVFSFFEKISTGATQFLTYLLIFFIYTLNQNIKTITAVAGTLLLGCLIGFILYFSFFQGYNEWAFNLKKDFFLHPEHSPGLVVNKYLHDFSSLAFFIRQHFSWLAIFPLYIMTSNYFPSYFSNKNIKYIKIPAILFSFLYLGYQVYKLNFYKSVFTNVGTSNYINAYFYIIVLLIQIFILTWIGLEKRIISVEFIKTNCNKLIVTILLLVTPFLGAIGTSNPLFLNVLTHVVPWFAVILVLSVYISKQIKNPILLSIFIIVPALITTSQIIDGNLFVPYYSVFNENKSNFFNQTEKITEIPLANGIYIDKQTKTFLLGLDSLLKNNNYRKKYPILGIWMPGIVYLFEGTSPGAPFYINGDNTADSNAFASFTQTNTPPILLVTENNPLKQRLLNCMQEKRIIFPDNYLYKGELYFPNYNSILKVYFPKNY